MKKFNLSLIALFFTVIFAGCQIFTTNFSAQEDSGIQVSKITLSQNSVTLSGSRNAANQTVTATVSPSFAQDTTVYWQSSDENICGLSATTGSSVTLILKGVGKATVTATDSSGSVSSTIDVTCVFETTPPFAVSSVSATPHANNVFFTWTDPVDYDNDLDHIEIVASNGEKTSVAAGVQYGWVKNLTAGTEYSFTLTAYDANGNASSAVSASATTTDSEDTTVPVAQTSLTTSANNGTSATFSWTCGTGTYQKLAVRAADSSELSLSAATSSNSVLSFTESGSSVVFDIPDNTTDLVTISGFETGKSYVLTLYELNADLVPSDASVEFEFTAAPSVSNVSPSIKYTGSIVVEWTDFNDSSYYYKAKATSVSDSTKSVESSNIAYGTQSAYLTGLDVGTEYSVIVSTYSSSGDLLATSATVSITPKTVLWHLLSGYSSGRYVCRNICSSVPNGYTVGAISSGLSTQEYWIVHSSLTGSADYFSLEASDVNGTSTGYYMYLDTTGRAQDSGTNLWTANSSYANKLQVATLDESYITSSRKDASFKLGSSTVKTGSGWYRLYDENLGYYIVHASLVFGGVSASTAEDTDGCAAVYIETSYIN